MGKNDSLPPGWGAKNQTPQGWGAGNSTPQGWGNKTDEQNDKLTDNGRKTSHTDPGSESSVESSNDYLENKSTGQDDEASIDAPTLVAENSTDSDSLQVLSQTPPVEEGVGVVSSESQKDKKQAHNHKLSIITLTVVIVLIISLIVGTFFYFSSRKEGKGDSNSDLKFDTTTQDIVYIPDTLEETFESESNDDLHDVTSDAVTSADITESDADETSQDAPIETTTSEPFESDTEDESDTSSPDEPIAFDPNDYMGYWHMGDSTERELSIYGINEGAIEFSLWYYRLTSIDGAVAYIDGNVATFSYGYPGEDKVEGTLIFNDSSVTVTITDSENVYMPVETMVFDSTHDWSWEFGGYDSEDDSPNLDEETVYETDVPSENEQSQNQIGTVVVNGITFSYTNFYHDENISYVLNSIDVKLIHDYSHSLMSDEYEVKIEGEITDTLGRACYLMFYEYDEEGYLLGQKYVSKSRIDGVFKTRDTVYLDQRTSKVVIDVGLFR